VGVGAAIRYDLANDVTDISGGRRGSFRGTCSRTEKPFAQTRETGAMYAARHDFNRKKGRRDSALRRTPHKLLCALIAVALLLPAAHALAQSGMLPIPLGGQQKPPPTPEEQERQEKIDADYKAATKKIPSQKAIDPWGDVRQSPTALAQKQKPSASASKKKQQ